MRNQNVVVGALSFAGLGLLLLTSLDCAGVKQLPQQSGAAGTGPTGLAGRGGTTPTGSGLSTGTAGTFVMPAGCNGPCTDFPTDPIIAVGVPSDVAGKFGTPSGNGPCVTEPEDGSLFPNNWLRPRIRVPGSKDVLKITIHADKEANDLVAYASGETWAMPKEIWMNLARHVVEEPISVTVQTPSGGATTVNFQIAPVGAAGSMVFWAADPAQAGKTGVESMAQSAVVNDSMLKGFTVGDESTADTLKITDVAQQVGTQDGKTQGSHCIGCHSGTPDGDYVGFVDAWPWAAAFAGVKPDSNNKTGYVLPSYGGGTCTSWNTCTGTTSRTYVQYPWGGPMAFSPAHWVAGDKMAIITSQMGDLKMPWMDSNWNAGKLIWLNLESTATTMYNGMTIPLEGTAFGTLARTGDPHPAAAFPTWSHDGRTVVYVSVACAQPGSKMNCGTQDGRLYKGPADLYQIPYGDKAGGAATPVMGAATTQLDEYYPSFSPDDQLIAYNAIPANPSQEMYANPNAELYVVRKGTGQSTRLAANDPPMCSGKKSPGINNHWPKWSPDAANVGGKRYYWIIFSSNRYGLPTVPTNFGGNAKNVEVSQLYITAVVTDEINTTTYKSIYLWNQPQNRLNTTPAWEHFNIPIVID